MECALNRESILCLEAWAAFAEAIGNSAAAPNGAASPSLSHVADVLLGVQGKDVNHLTALPSVERALRSLPLGMEADRWARVAGAACRQEWPTAASVPDLPLAASKRVLALAMLGFFDEHADLAKRWEAGEVISDAEIQVAVAKTREGARRREFNFFVHVVGSMATIADAKTRSGSASSSAGSTGVCALRSVKGVWKQPSSYPSEDTRLPSPGLYATGRPGPPRSCGRTGGWNAVAIGVLVLLAAATLRIALQRCMRRGASVCASYASARGATA